MLPKHLRSLKALNIATSAVRDGAERFAINLHQKLRSIAMGKHEFRIHHKHGSLIPLLALTISGCAIGKDSVQKPKDEKAVTKSQTTAAAPKLVIQPAWQNKFEQALIKLGAGAEGFALFSDSGMGHNGQQMVIAKAGRSEPQVCLAPQAKDDCTFTKRDVKSVGPVFVLADQSDKLTDLSSKSFDGISQQYVHLRVGKDSSLERLAQVNFTIDSQKLPESYERLFKTFSALK
jgi:hypothetical protein